MRKLPLARKHLKIGARMGGFASWEVPILYKSIREEYFTCKNVCGLFDISHLGKFVVKGKDAGAFMELVSTRCFPEGVSLRGKVSFFLNVRGGVVDMSLVYKIEEKKFLIFTNAGAREKFYLWISYIANQHHLEIDVEDYTERSLLFSIQGPKSQAVVKKAFSQDLSSLPRFGWKELKMPNQDLMIMRSAFSYEDGFEVWCREINDGEIWEVLLQCITEEGGCPCGFGVRDLLRFEASLPLYGQEIDETVTPLELKKEHLIEWEKENFIGKNSLCLEQKIGPKKQLVGIEITEGKKIPRYGYPVYNSQSLPCGYITSGNYSFLFKKILGLAFLDRQNCFCGRELVISAPGGKIKGRVVDIPFITSFSKKGE